MSKQKYFFLLRCSITLCIVLYSLACGGGNSSTTSETGTLHLKANGEQFVQNGFTSKDGWAIQFSHVYITIANPTAFQVQDGITQLEKPRFHAGHSHAGLAAGGEHQVSLGEHLIDLKKGDSHDNNKVLLKSFSSVKIGNYNRLAWSMVNTSSSSSLLTGLSTADAIQAMGNCVTLMGNASKSGNIIDFKIAFDEEVYYQTTEANEAEGIVAPGGEGTAEMTFHFDHIFGDLTTPLDEGVNPDALGFQPFADLDTNTDGKIEVNLNTCYSSMSATHVNSLLKDYYTLGHSGESHAMFIPGFSPSDSSSSEETSTVGIGTGTLNFNVNGEDFIRNGFTSKDGWAISFDHAYCGISDYTAYTSSTAESITTSGNYILDLKEGVDALNVHTNASAKAGHYDRISFSLCPINTSTAEFYGSANTNPSSLTSNFGSNVLVLTGQATSGSNVISFSFAFDQDLGWMSIGPYGSDDGTIPDMLPPNETSAVEATFHIDHIFGDYSTPQGEGVNAGACGFQPFAELVPGENGTLTVNGLFDLQNRLSGNVYSTFFKAFLTLGHSGEEHCLVMFE
ncbi:MAG: hypothetical protein HQK65_23355 [Desulfamplus sp.]|nr:hypothetical protein [Desulfamplus sp.]